MGISRYTGRNAHRSWIQLAGHYRSGDDRCRKRPGVSDPGCPADVTFRQGNRRNFVIGLVGLLCDKRYFCGSSKNAFGEVWKIAEIRLKNWKKLLKVSKTGTRY